jgi:hypothetical protein
MFAWDAHFHIDLKAKVTSYVYTICSFLLTTEA